MSFSRDDAVAADSERVAEIEAGNRLALIRVERSFMLRINFLSALSSRSSLCLSTIRPFKWLFTVRLSFDVASSCNIVIYGFFIIVCCRFTWFYPIILCATQWNQLVAAIVTVFIIFDRFPNVVRFVLTAIQRLDNRTVKNHIRNKSNMNQTESNQSISFNQENK